WLPGRGGQVAFARARLAEDEAEGSAEPDADWLPGRGGQAAFARARLAEDEAQGSAAPDVDWSAEQVEPTAFAAGPAGCSAAPRPGRSRRGRMDLRHDRPRRRRDAHGWRGGRRVGGRQ